MEKRIRYTCLYIYMFFILYMPFFGNSVSVLFNKFIMSVFLLILVVFFEFRNIKEIGHLLQDRRLVYYILGILVAGIYYAFRVIVSGKDYSIEDLRIVQNWIVIIYILHALVIVVILKKRNNYLEDVFELLFRVTSIQGIICIFMFAFPQFKNIANIMYASNSSFNLGDYIMLKRIYGLSSDYTYGMPIMHGCLSAICFFFGIVKNRKYFIYFPLIFIVAALNSRTGLLVGLMGIFFGFIYYGIKYKFTRKVAKTIMIILVMFIALLMILCSNEYTYQFLSVLFQEAYEFIFHGNKTGTINYLLESHLYFPKGAGFVFGEGHNVRGVMAQKNGYLLSDIGFVNDMFMGGIIYCSILYGSTVCFVFKRFSEIIIKYVQYILATTWIIANLKGQITVNHTFTMFLILCVIFIVFFKPQEEGTHGFIGERY